MGSHFLLNEIGLLVLHKNPVSRLEHLGSARVWQTGPLEEMTGGRTLHCGEEHVLSLQRSIHSSQAADGGHTTTWVLVGLNHVHATAVGYSLASKEPV